MGSVHSSMDACSGRLPPTLNTLTQTRPAIRHPDHPRRLRIIWPPRHVRNRSRRLRLPLHLQPPLVIVAPATPMEAQAISWEMRTRGPIQGVHGMHMQGPPKPRDEHVSTHFPARPPNVITAAPPAATQNRPLAHQGRPATAPQPARARLDPHSPPVLALLGPHSLHPAAAAAAQQHGEEEARAEGAPAEQGTPQLQVRSGPGSASYLCLNVDITGLGDGLSHCSMFFAAACCPFVVRVSHVATVCTSSACLFTRLHQTKPRSPAFPASQTLPL